MQKNICLQWLYFVKIKLFNSYYRFANLRACVTHFLAVILVYLFVFSFFLCLTVVFRVRALEAESPFDSKQNCASNNINDTLHIKFCSLGAGDARPNSVSKLRQKSKLVLKDMTKGADCCVVTLVTSSIDLHLPTWSKFSISSAVSSFESRLHSIIWSLFPKCKNKNTMNAMVCKSYKPTFY